jgi:cysteine desulfurase
MDNIYLDYAATTPVDPDVMNKMEQYFLNDFGNPSSSHYYGQKAETAVENSRQVIAEILGGKSNGIVFTGGGSEGDNLAIRGAALAARKKNKKANKILISPVEHHAVSKTAIQLHTEFGFELEEMRVDNYGTIDLDKLNKQLNSEISIVSVIYANNEIGTINPVKEISMLCHKKGVLFHSDAVQACSHLDVNIGRDEIDILTIAAHKFYGPKGVGGLIYRSGVELLPQITGGKQENDLRAGTHNVPGIVGMAAALQNKNNGYKKINPGMIQLRDKIINSVLGEIPGAFLTGHPTLRLANHASFVFKGINGNDLVILLDMAGFACSSGSACKVGNPEPSEVLLALGLTPELALGSLRVTLGKMTTLDQVDRFLAVLPGLVAKLRK